jgi:hypothetical protein
MIRRTDHGVLSRRGPHRIQQPHQRLRCRDQASILASVHRSQFLRQRFVPHLRVLLMPGQHQLPVRPVRQLPPHQPFQAVIGIGDRRRRCALQPCPRTCRQCGQYQRHRIHSTTPMLAPLTHTFSEPTGPRNQVRPARNGTATSTSSEGWWPRWRISRHLDNGYQDHPPGLGSQCGPAEKSETVGTLMAAHTVPQPRRCRGPWPGGRRAGTRACGRTPVPSRCR